MGPDPEPGSAPPTPTATHGCWDMEAPAWDGQEEHRDGWDEERSAPQLGCGPANLLLCSQEPEPGDGKGGSRSEGRGLGPHTPGSSSSSAG